MTESIRVAIVDDHPIYREGVAKALDKPGTISVVAQGSSAREAEQIVAAYEPHVILLDIAMPGGGLDAALRILCSGTPTKVVMLTGSEDDDHVTTALDAGASGYLLKGVDREELVTAVLAVQRGELYIPPSISTRLIQRRFSKNERGDAALLSALNTRERTILEHAAKGLSNVEIAEELGLALPTVKNYMSRIFDKLQVRNRIEAITIASRASAKR